MLYVVFVWKYKAWIRFWLNNLNGFRNYYYFLFLGLTVAHVHAELQVNQTYDALNKLCEVKTARKGVDSLPESRFQPVIRTKCSNN